MRPEEHATKRRIRRRFSKDFAYSERLLVAIHRLHGRLCDKDVVQAQKHTKCVLVGLLTKICKQYRSILVLSELGLVEDAEVVTRSLAESTLQTLFIVKRNIRLRRGWRSAPKRPRGGFSMAFRAKLYLARDALDGQKWLNAWKNSRGLRRATRRLSKPIDDMVQTANKWLGEKWMTWLRSGKSYEAFKVQTMAANLGLGLWYEVVYRRQSNVAHASDGMAHLVPGDAPMTIDVQLGGDIEHATTSLLIANEMCRISGQVINARFRLGFNSTLKELAAGARAVLEGA